MQNYIVVFILPSELQKKIKEIYRKTFNKDLTITNLHLTFLPPFSLKEDVDLKTVKENLKKFKKTKIKAFFSSPDLFRNPGETILFLPVEPKGKITDLYERINNQNKNLIKFETSLYHTDEVPPFLPHVSLDYDFTFNSKTLKKLEENLEKFYFDIKCPILVKRKASGY